VKVVMNLRICNEGGMYRWELWRRGVGVNKFQWYKSTQLATKAAKNVAKMLNITINKIEYT